MEVQLCSNLISKRKLLIFIVAVVKFLLSTVQQNAQESINLHEIDNFCKQYLIYAVEFISVAPHTNMA